MSLILFGELSIRRPPGKALGKGVVSKPQAGQNLSVYFETGTGPAGCDRICP